MGAGGEDWDKITELTSGGVECDEKKGLKGNPADEQCKGFAVCGRRRSLGPRARCVIQMSKCSREVREACWRFEGKTK